MVIILGQSYCIAYISPFQHGVGSCVEVSIWLYKPSTQSPTKNRKTSWERKKNVFPAQFPGVQVFIYRIIWAVNKLYDSAAWLAFDEYNTHQESPSLLFLQNGKCLLKKYMRFPHFLKNSPAFPHTLKFCSAIYSHLFWWFHQIPQGFSPTIPHARRGTACNEAFGPKIWLCPMEFSACGGIRFSIPCAWDLLGIASGWR